MNNDWSRYELALLLQYLLHGEKERVELLLQHKKVEELPVVLRKVLQQIADKNKELGLSMSEIVELGNMLECSFYKETSLKNWVKREIKQFIGVPHVGKKYSIHQAALLYIVKDLKTILDFDLIRHVLALVFNNPMDRSDDHLSPADFFLQYAQMYEKLMVKEKVLTETVVSKEVEEYVMTLRVGDEQKEHIAVAFKTALLSTRASYLRGTALKYINGMNALN
ncbi:DUF1836 domain-containing protein [Sutcliffiella sp. NC1]|uniref:DUF1836 domain-containing protein n=1 Tax=Sutcliffiella sp. NC1 TaxID=3004096 RepID=UPI0022DDEDAE|nr:DUF1836 domain-containing protein [Sutcliffiella sp. NC1]WBL15022.1 DUF1836 domain-containing protein [Sutcliffiella sp. NC1]